MKRKEIESVLDNAFVTNIYDRLLNKIYSLSQMFHFVQWDTI